MGLWGLGQSDEKHTSNAAAHMLGKSGKLGFLQKGDQHLQLTFHRGHP